VKPRNQFCTFYLNDMLFGVEVEKVQEVVNHRTPTRVPLASSVVEGLMNQRGQVVLALDLRRRLRLPERPAEQLPMIVSVLCQGRTINLLVDQIGDVIRTTSEQFREVPQTLKGLGRELIQGAFDLNEKLLLILDLEKIVTLDGNSTKSITAEPVASV
jgi:purine-binding chemotaxis protein CheW